MHRNLNLFPFEKVHGQQLSTKQKNKKRQWVIVRTIRFFLLIVLVSVVDISILPTAPRAAADIDYSTVPANPPFIAHVANLPFDIEEEQFRRIFADLNVRRMKLVFGEGGGENQWIFL